jgi:tRNA (cytidine/uridine-2'-O-)-methyltransferase
VIRLAIYQPDIPQNTGTMLRLAACFGIGVDIIEPAGFPTSDRAFRRAGMDYLDHVALERHDSFETFENRLRGDGRRLVLATRHAGLAYTKFGFSNADTLLVGRESAGVPEFVHSRATARITVPIRQELRSLNVAMASAMLLGEALRQTGDFPASGLR